MSEATPLFIIQYIYMFVCARVGFVSRNVSPLHCHESFKNVKLKFNKKCDFWFLYFPRNSSSHLGEHSFGNTALCITFPELNMNTPLQCTEYGTLCGMCLSVVVFVYRVTVVVCTLNHQFFGRWESSVCVVEFSSGSVFVPKSIYYKHCVLDENGEK